MTKQEYSTLIAQMAATIYAGVLSGNTVLQSGSDRCVWSVQTAKQFAALSGIEEPKEEPESNQEYVPYGMQDEAPNGS